jgi:hypothetical protein
MAQPYTTRFPELNQFLNDIEDRFQRSQLPPESVILDDLDVMRMLKISKRKLAQLRADRLIQFYRTGRNGKTPRPDRPASARRSGKIYYTLKGVMDYINQFKVAPINKSKLA